MKIHILTPKLLSLDPNSFSLLKISTVKDEKIQIPTTKKLFYPLPSFPETQRRHHEELTITNSSDTPEFSPFTSPQLHPFVPPRNQRFSGLQQTVTWLSIHRPSPSHFPATIRLRGRFSRRTMPRETRKSESIIFERVLFEFSQPGKTFVFVRYSGV